MKKEDVYDYITKDMASGIAHGVLVANLTGRLATILGLSDKEIYELKQAALIHDIGKLKLTEYLYGRKEGLSIEEMKYMRMHSKLSYEIIKDYDYSENVKNVVLWHHECFDGSGYPDNLAGEAIPIGARILKVTDEFAALISDRPYRKAFDIDTAVQIMIEEIKNVDLKVFLAFQQMIHEKETIEIINKSKIDVEELDLDDILSIEKN